VLYELLTGELPWTGPTTHALLAQRLAESPRPLGTARAGLPIGLEQTVIKALARLPADRFQTAAEFRDALAGAAQLPGPVPGAPTVPPALRPPGRHRRLSAAVALLAVGLLVGLGVLLAWLRS
jgi:eukaryotic-like serine/threonine-protein kinase